ncbi:MAG: diguanylate cyclase (GGDEF)-like protein/PAS domain S-box-containing protein [Gammaproteobacteria bacterium]|jgi:diguanylate cyclase (GGDEF)-like protein/PAS domain S-box-containing protein
MPLEGHDFSILDSLWAQIAILDATGVIIHVNEAWASFAKENGGANELAHGVGLNYLTVCVATEEMSSALTGLQGVISKELDTFGYEYPCHSPTEARWSWMRVTSYKNSPGHTIVSHFDITERKLGEQALRAARDDLEERVRSRTEELRAEKLRAEVTLSSIGDAVITTDAHGSIDFLNPVAEQLTGWRSADAVGQPIEAVFPLLNEADRTPVRDPVRRCILQGVVVGIGGHTILVARDGKEYFIQDSAAPIWDGMHRLLGVVLVFSDVSERYRPAREASHQAAHQAAHDPLTGLVNRREFEVRLQRALDDADGEGRTHALAYLDLDHFKVINDTGGHGAGDAVLRQLAVLMSAQIRSRDTFARLGGDEFGLLMEHCSLEQATGIAEKLKTSITDHRFVWEQHSFRVGASLGLAAIDGSGTDMFEVLRRADAACYVAKETGRNRIHIYRDDDLKLVERHGAMQWVSRIEIALDEHRFRLYYQPIIALAEGVLAEDDVRCELLLRMVDEQGEIVLPGAFLPAAERYYLATKIDRWVVHHAFIQLTRSPALVERLTHCAINLSGQSLADPSMAYFIESEFEKTQFPPQKICFEVTETAAIANFDAATGMLDRLHAIGCKFALDDLGSGLSSFTYLKTLAVDFLKIDGAFVKDIVDDRVDYEMVKSINDVRHVASKIIIAEFAETDAIIAKLRGIGVDYAQGYAVGRPEPLDGLLLGKKPTIGVAAS